LTGGNVTCGNGCSLSTVMWHYLSLIMCLSGSVAVSNLIALLFKQETVLCKILQQHWCLSQGVMWAIY